MSNKGPAPYHGDKPIHARPRRADELWRPWPRFPRGPSLRRSRSRGAYASEPFRPAGGLKGVRRHLDAFPESSSKCLHPGSGLSSAHQWRHAGRPVDLRRDAQSARNSGGFRGLPRRAGQQQHSIVQASAAGASTSVGRRHGRGAWRTTTTCAVEYDAPGTSIARAALIDRRSPSSGATRVRFPLRRYDRSAACRPR